MHQGRNRHNQNALFQVWGRELAAYLAKCETREVTVAMHEDTKTALKKAYYADTAAECMVRMATDPITGKETKTLASSKELDRGEFFAFMEWVQAFAATKGLMLESMVHQLPALDTPAGYALGPILKPDFLLELERLPIFCNSI